MSSARSLRLWPGLAIVVVQWIFWLLVPEVFPEMLPAGVFAGLLGGVLMLVWWLAWSRAPGRERWIGAGLVVVGLAATSQVLHPSVAGGMMGLLLFVYAVPLVTLLFVGAATATRNSGAGARMGALAGAVLLGCLPWALVRTNGISGDASADFAWRWSPTAEERLLALEPGPESPEPPAVIEAPLVAEAPEAPEATAAPVEAAPEVRWPGFRGAGRDSVVGGTRLAVDWEVRGPQKIWSRAVGPGWSSFAVRGDVLYTQEQRGEEELVSAYSLETGEPVWERRTTARFWESNAGAGPRATPTLAGDRLYALGATGVLNALRADDGAVLWTRNAAEDAQVSLPGWGFSGSPLVVDDVVVVALAGRLAGYEVATGDPRWIGPDGGGGYSSPHGIEIDGVPQIMLMSGAGAVSLSPADGTQLWRLEMPSNARIVQPASADAHDLLLSEGESNGIRRVSVRRDGAAWTAETRWESFRLKPYFNDFVLHRGIAYGFDGGILAAIDLTDGRRRWKGGRYGQGQLLLLADQDLLLVLGEEGDLALVRAAPDGFEERARAAGIEGKTWNHPALVDDLLLVRNGEEMAAFRLPVR